eukprot:CAMPEP_0202111844 /NCGR_PEP_ID=MMETSP0965-20130614/30212_1 /ASSEMBLY_ACC=CAM_ASM_000507 /TAXON_ID=4773 /ORGANISM="Schizochytrium aggregatum, Strain ATCC28209" /LENGTH=72 /DNA_ID=CAMNT_0048681357 /DNA_START=9 /DNA_END=223 /DNA_ORIENTATION=-
MTNWQAYPTRNPRRCVLKTALAASGRMDAPSPKPVRTSEPMTANWKTSNSAAQEATTTSSKAMPVPERLSGP